MMTKREALRAILDGKSADRILAIPCAFSMPIAQAGYDMVEAFLDPEKMANAMVTCRQRLGYDGYVAGTYNPAGSLAGHLTDAEGNPSPTGEDTIRSMEDIGKIRSIDFEHDPFMQGLLGSIRKLRELDPEEPVFAIMIEPAYAALTMIGASRAYKSMIKNQAFFNAVTEAIEEECLKAYKMVWDAGVDFLWFPSPNFSSTCISRKAYEKCVSESNIRVLNAMKDYGAKIILHTCGVYDDRFDLVVKEGGDVWHLSETNTKKVKEEWGDKVALMGEIPCVKVFFDGTPEEVYNYTYQECMDGGYDGRFIVSGDCDIPPATTDENMKAYVQAAKDATEKLFGNK